MPKKLIFGISDLDYVGIMVLVYKTPFLFPVKLVYSYVIEVANSKSTFGLHGSALVSLKTLK